MKIKFSLTDDNGKEYRGEVNLTSEKIPTKQKTISGKQKIETNKYSGQKGGIMLLIDDGFFNSLKSADEVFTELKKEGHFHNKEGIRKSLVRDFVGGNRLLIRIKEDNVWKYALRK